MATAMLRDTMTALIAQSDRIRENRHTAQKLNEVAEPLQQQNASNSQVKACSPFWTVPLH